MAYDEGPNYVFLWPSPKKSSHPPHLSHHRPRTGYNGPSNLTISHCNHTWGPQTSRGTREIEDEDGGLYLTE